jgi:uncharacterized Zn finger protein (UPF0148 family)
LLSRHCPECSSPLVQKDNDTFCASCDAQILSEMQASAMGALTSSRPAAAAHAASTSSIEPQTASLRRYLDDQVEGEGSWPSFENLVSQQIHSA